MEQKEKERKGEKEIEKYYQTNLFSFGFLHSVLVPVSSFRLLSFRLFFFLSSFFLFLFLSLSVLSIWPRSFSKSFFFFPLRDVRFSSPLKREIDEERKRGKEEIKKKERRKERGKK